MSNRRTGLGVRALVSAAALLGLLASASPALASMAGLTTEGVNYTANSNEANDVRITASNKSWGWASVIDIADAAGVTIQPMWPDFHLGGCDVNELRPGVVWCVLENDQSSIVAHLADLNDRFSNSFGRRTTVSGGAGIDTADYSARSAAVTVSLNNVADDGQDPGGDNVLADVENVDGGSAGDRLTGSSADNVLSGGAGDDVLVGSGGNDRLYGSAGNDTLDGEQPSAMAGRDRLNGGGGDDRIYAYDGERDHIDCGSGNDTVDADPIDDLRDCN
jgi:Ca2+-binding RTX toxin-like protein